MNTDLVIFSFGLAVTLMVFAAIAILMVQKYHVTLPATRSTSLPDREATESA